jgi:hypothetical protein
VTVPEVPAVPVVVVTPVPAAPVVVVVPVPAVPVAVPVLELPVTEDPEPIFPLQPVIRVAVRTTLLVQVCMALTSRCREGTKGPRILQSTQPAVGS